MLQDGSSRMLELMHRDWIVEVHDPNLQCDDNYYLHWPTCHRLDKSEIGMTPVYANLDALGLNCSADDCEFTDSFDTESVAECSTICSQIPDCETWTIGVRTGHNQATCFFRKGDTTSAERSGKF